MAKKSKPKDEDEGAAIINYLSKQLDEFYSQDLIATGELWPELKKKLTEAGHPSQTQE